MAYQRQRSQRYLAYVNFPFLELTPLPSCVCFFVTQTNRIGCEKLSASRRRTEHFQPAQAGCRSGLDPALIENFEDVFFYRGFAIAEDRCNLAVGFALSKPEQGFCDPRG